MATILSIQSSARNEGSFSREFSAQIIEKLGGSTQNIIVNRDLAQALPQVDEAWLGANWTPAEQRTDEQKSHMALSDTLVAEIKQAHILVIGAPIYNFSVPASLKLWIDLVARAGETFRYTEGGPVGLLEGKKAYIVVTSGGVPIDSPYDFATPYLRQVLGFIGITDIEVIAADGLVNAEAESRAKAENAISLLAA